MRGTNSECVCYDAEPWVRDSLFALGGVYLPLGPGRWIYPGERPGEGWHGHGYFPKTLTMLCDGAPKVVQVFKHRWIDTVTGQTVHSRPPDDPVLVRYCMLILFLRVWAVISSDLGFRHRTEFFEGLENDCGSDRTVQRWSARMTENAMEIHQAIRLAIIEEVEPRPVESLFDGGLSPPHVVTQKRWKSPSNIPILYQGCAMLLVASRELALHASHLLAGARRRFPKAEKTFGI